MKKERQSNLELLRVICMVLIVAYHEQRSFSFTPDAQGIFIKSVGGWGLLGVYCFIAISAWFLQQQQFRFEKLYRIFCQTGFYMAVFMVFHLINVYMKGGNIWQELWKSTHYALLQPLWVYRYWFISVYILLYLLSPFLNKLISGMDDVLYKKLMIVLTVIPFFGFFYNGQGTLFDLLYFIYVYLLVGLLRRMPGNVFEKYAGRGFFICVALFAFGYVTALFSDPLYAFFCYAITNVHRHAVIMVVAAMFLFYLFHNLKMKPRKGINRLATLMFGVYLFHENKVFNLSDLSSDFFDAVIPMHLSDTALFLLTVVFLFVGGCLFEWVRKLIFDKPIYCLFKNDKLFAGIDKFFEI